MAIRKLPVTDPEMTRFWIMLDQGVDLVLAALQAAIGGEIFVPKIPSMSVSGLLSAMPDDCEAEIIGRRPGEKMHEVLINDTEGARTIDCGDYFVILPESLDDARRAWAARGQLAPADFVYASNTNDQWATTAEMQQMVATMRRRR